MRTSPRSTRTPRRVGLSTLVSTQTAPSPMTNWPGTSAEPEADGSRTLATRPPVRSTRHTHPPCPSSSHALPSPTASDPAGPGNGKPAVTCRLRGSSLSRRQGPRSLLQCTDHRLPAPAAHGGLSSGRVATTRLVTGSTRTTPAPVPTHTPPAPTASRFTKSPGRPSRILAIAMGRRGSTPTRTPSTTTHSLPSPTISASATATPSISQRPRALGAAPPTISRPPLPRQTDQLDHPTSPQRRPDRRATHGPTTQRRCVNLTGNHYERSPAAGGGASSSAQVTATLARTSASPTSTAGPAAACAS